MGVSNVAFTIFNFYAYTKLAAQNDYIHFKITRFKKEKKRWITLLVIQQLIVKGTLFARSSIASYSVPSIFRCLAFFFFKQPACLHKGQFAKFDSAHLTMNFGRI